MPIKIAAGLNTTSKALVAVKLPHPESAFKNTLFKALGRCGTVMTLHASTAPKGVGFAMAITLGAFAISLG